MPKVSVVIPAYNAMDFLPETLQSVLDQTFSDFEVLIINDGSSDNIEQWVQTLKDNRVSLISTVNQGAASARNVGIDKSRGEYIAFLDADDLWAATKLEKQVRCLDRHAAAGLVYTWTEIIDQKGRPTGQILSPKPRGNVLPQILRENFVTCGSTPLVRSVCLREVGRFSSGLEPAEDWDLWIRIGTRYQFAAIEEPLVQYRQHSDNASKCYERMLNSSSAVIERAFQNAPENLARIKGQAYSTLKLYLSWTVLNQGNIGQSFQFWKEAATRNPRVLYSPKYIRLSLALILMRCLGPATYKKLVEMRRSPQCLVARASEQSVTQPPQRGRAYRTASNSTK